MLRENNAVFDDQVGVVRLLDALLPELGEAMTGVFTESSAAGREFERVAEALGGTLIEAFKGAAFEGESFREVLLQIVQDILVLSQSSLGGGAGNSRKLLQQAVETGGSADQAILTTTMYNARNANKTTRPNKKISPFSRYLVQCKHWGAVRPTILPQSPHVSVVMSDASFPVC